MAIRIQYLGAVIIFKNLNMKRAIISITMILITIFNLQSCRHYDRDHIEETKNPAMEKTVKNFSMEKDSDSLKITNQENYTDQDNSTLLDPPPKDRNQWKN